MRGRLKLMLSPALGAFSALALAIAPAEAGIGFKECGDVAKVGAGAYNVKAKHVGCTKARRIAGAYFKQPDTKIGSFNCGESQLGDELFRGRCTRTDPRGVVKFLFGA